jgi:hypothetical protein
MTECKTTVPQTCFPVCVGDVVTFNGTSHVGCIAFKITCYVFAILKRIESQVELNLWSNPDLVPQFVIHFVAVCQGWWEIEILLKTLWVWNWQLIVWRLPAGLKKGVVYWNFSEHFWQSSESCNVGWLGKCKWAVVRSIKATFNNM